MVENRSPAKDSRVSINPENWVDQYGNALYAYALVRVRKPDVAEEMVQETFLAALHARKNFKGRSSEKTWLIGILKHKIIDYFRKDSRRQSLKKKDTQNDFTDEMFDRNGNWLDGPARWDFDPSKSLEQKEFFKVFHDCLSKLPPRLSQVFVLRELDGLEAKEICDIINISPNNLWVMLYRARSQLRRHLEVLWFDKTGQEKERDGKLSLAQ
ncbi:MAG: sigma-70 family RNA polymerase sigma factor [Desulfobacterales bacterium]|nr:MAG: sigma-70 family RNA polymerase sigma factor [Desulfobacterales bacterium]